MLFSVALLIIVFSSLSGSISSQDLENVEENVNECALYLAQSPIAGAGMGVFAGKSYALGEEIDKSYTLIVESVIIQSLPAINYVYSSLNDNYAAYLLGAAPMMNHITNPNTERTILTGRNGKMDVQSVSLRPYSVYHDFSFTAKKEIAVGNEIFSNYGDSSWFEEREILFNDTTASQAAEDIPGYTLEELVQTRGHCLSDAVVRESTIPMAGKGLFTTKPVETGELAALSPGLFVPHHRIAIAGTSSVLLNYCFVAPGADVALLPVGHSAMVNHGGKQRANVKIVWYNAIHNKEGEREEVGKGGGMSQTQRLEEADPETLVDREGSAVYFAYEALRSLDPGEELLLDYGSAWEQQWQRYLQALTRWLELHSTPGRGESDETDVSLAPQFRHPVHVPVDFFPPNFFKSCVGLDCDRQSVKGHSRDYQHMVLNTKKHSMLTLASVREASQQSEDRRASSVLSEEECVTSGGARSVSSRAVIVGLQHCQLAALTGVTVLSLLLLLLL